MVAGVSLAYGSTLRVELISGRARSAAMVNYFAASAVRAAPPVQAITQKAQPVQDEHLPS